MDKKIHELVREVLFAEQRCNPYARDDHMKRIRAYMKIEFMILKQMYIQKNLEGTMRFYSRIKYADKVIRTNLRGMIDEEYEIYFHSVNETVIRYVDAWIGGAFR